MTFSVPRYTCDRHYLPDDFADDVMKATVKFGALHEVVVFSGLLGPADDLPFVFDERDRTFVMIAVGYVLEVPMIQVRKYFQPVPDRHLYVDVVTSGRILWEG